MSANVIVKPRMTYKKTKDGKFVCPTCGEIKEKQNTMFYHMQTHVGKLPYECNICKKSFVQKQELLLHKQRKHAEEEKKTKADTVKFNEIKCPYDDCDFSNIRKGNVRTHCMRKHASEYITKDTIKYDGINYNCLVCKFNSTSLSGIYYHLSTCLLTNNKIPAKSDLAEKLNTLA